jgi:hypothetical protein
VRVVEVPGIGSCYATSPPSRAKIDRQPYLIFSLADNPVEDLTYFLFSGFLMTSLATTVLAFMKRTSRHSIVLKRCHLMTNYRIRFPSSDDNIQAKETSDESDTHPILIMGCAPKAPLGR